MIRTSSWPLARVGVGQDPLLTAPDPLMMLVMMMGDKVPQFYIYKLPIDRPWRLLFVILSMVTFFMINNNTVLMLMLMRKVVMTVMMMR